MFLLLSRKTQLFCDKIQIFLLYVFFCFSAFFQWSQFIQKQNIKYLRRLTNSKGFRKFSTLADKVSQIVCVSVSLFQCHLNATYVINGLHTHQHLKKYEVIFNFNRRHYLSLSLSLSLFYCFCAQLLVRIEIEMCLETKIKMEVFLRNNGLEKLNFQAYCCFLRSN